MEGVQASAALPLVGALVGLRKLRSAQAEDESPHTKKVAMVASCLIYVCVLYGFVVAFVINKNLAKHPPFSPSNAALAAGLTNGLTAACAAAGLGSLGATAVRTTEQQPRLFVGFVLIAIYAEAFALYGLIVGIITVTKASKALIDLPPGAVLSFASADILANIVGVLGTVVIGKAILEVGVTKPELVMRCMIPVVLSGVTGIYGLMTTVIDTAPWPPKGDNTIAGGLYLLSGLGLTYAGYHGVQGVAQNPRSFTSMVSKLTACQSIGLAGLIMGLVQKGGFADDDFSTSDDAMSSAPVMLLSFPRSPGTSSSLAAIALTLLVAFPLILALPLVAWRRQSAALDAPLLA